MKNELLSKQLNILMVWNRKMNFIDWYEKINFKSKQLNILMIEIEPWMLLIDMKNELLSPVKSAVFSSSICLAVQAFFTLLFYSFLLVFKLQVLLKPWLEMWNITMTDLLIKKLLLTKCDWSYTEVAPRWTWALQSQVLNRFSFFFKVNKSKNLVVVWNRTKYLQITKNEMRSD